MTAAQSLSIYELINRHFKNEVYSKAFVNELELVIAEESEKGSQVFAGKSFFELLRKDIELIRQELKTTSAEVRYELRSEVNRLQIWIFGAIFASAGLIIAVLKII
jgi:hypothetical protein